MTATQLQFRRGTAAQMATFTGAIGEVVVDTDNKRVVVHDNATAGGWPHARLADVYPQHGRLSVVGATQVKFAPYGGSWIKIGGLLYPIPSAGVTAANTGVYVNGVAGLNLAVSTFYYVYLFSNSGTLTVDFSTTGHATDTAANNVGVEIKSGDNSRTLIGWIYTTAAAQFANVAANGNLVYSWFNPAPTIPLNYTGLANNSITGTTSYKSFGFGENLPFVPMRSGNVFIGGSFRAVGTTVSAGNGDDYEVAYGTGSPPALGGAETGTQAFQITCTTPNGVTNYYPLIGAALGLTVGQPYWFDLAGLLGASTATMQIFGPVFCFVEM